MSAFFGDSGFTQRLKPVTAKTRTARLKACPDTNLTPASVRGEWQELQSMSALPPASGGRLGMTFLNRRLEALRHLGSHQS